MLLHVLQACTWKYNGTLPYNDPTTIVTLLLLAPYSDSNKNSVSHLLIILKNPLT